MQKLFKSCVLNLELGRIVETDTRTEWIVDETVQIKTPITIDVNIKKSLTNYTNSAVFIIKGLSEETRNKIYRNRLEGKKFIGVDFTAGYGGSLYRIFYGRCVECYSFRNGGDTIYSTVMTCDSFTLLREKKIAETFAAGTSYYDVCNTVLSTIKGYSISASLADELRKKKLIKAYSTPNTVAEVLKDLTKGNFYESDGVLYKIDGQIDRAPVLINASTGLLSTPIIQSTTTSLTTLFEPQLAIGQPFLLQSDTNAQANGVYACLSIHHKGVISGGVQSKVITDITGSTVQGLSILENK